MTLPGDVIVGDFASTSPGIVIGDPVYLGITTVVTPPGSGNVGMIYNQVTPLATWTIPHTFSRFPSVTVVDNTNTVIITDVEYPNETTVVLTFAQPIIGKALLV